MAAINLDSQTIQNIGTEVETLDTTLLNSYFPELESELSAIANNVQGSEVHSVLNQITAQFGTVKSDLSTMLPKLESFLGEQMTTYSTTEEELDGELKAVLQKMALIAGEGPKNFDTGNQNDNSNEPTKEPELINTPEKMVEKVKEEQQNSEPLTIEQRLEALEKQNAELTAQNAELSKSSWQKYKDDLKDNYNFSEGNFITEAIGGTRQTLGDTHKAMWGDGLFGTALGKLGEIDGKIIKGIGKII